MVKISCLRTTPFCARVGFPFIMVLWKRIHWAMKCNILNATQIFEHFKTGRDNHPKAMVKLLASPVEINYPSAGYVEWWPLGWFTLALFWLVPLCDSAALMYSRHLCRTSGEACLFLFFSSHSLSLVVVLNKIPASYWYICSLISGLDCCQYQKLDIEISFFMHQLPWN